MEGIASNEGVEEAGDDDGEAYQQEEEPCEGVEIAEEGVGLGGPEREPNAFDLFFAAGPPEVDAAEEEEEGPGGDEFDDASGGSDEELTVDLQDDSEEAADGLVSIGLT